MLKYTLNPIIGATVLVASNPDVSESTRPIILLSAMMDMTGSALTESVT